MSIIFSHGHATQHLAVSVSRLVGWSVGWSIGRSVGWSVTFFNSERFSDFSSCPTTRDWIAVYPVLFYNQSSYFFGTKQLTLVCNLLTCLPLSPSSANPPPLPLPTLSLLLLPHPSAIKPLCGKDGYHAHPFDCSRYIVCSPGRIFACTCPDGLYFNKNSNTCDRRENVQCVKPAQQGQGQGQPQKQTQQGGY